MVRALVHYNRQTEMPLPLEPGAALKHYRIVELLGKGGMGEVYAAEDTRLGRKVAIKCLPRGLAADPERLRRFTQEAKAASALNHPSILTIHDVDEVDGQPFMVTEFIDGQTLRERLQAPAAAITLGEAIDIAGQVASALSAAHVAGIVHRDVKPENIMLREDGHAKLVDFGLAKIEQDALAGSTDETVAAVGAHTTPGIVMGTTAYMSPEQARGLPVDARSDIFSLGVVLYEMAAGRPPFQGETPSDVIAAILRFEPAAVADLPPDLEHTLRKALEKDRDERYQTAKDLAADLKRLRRRLDPSAGTPPTPTGQGAGAWSTTPKSGGAAASGAASRAGSTAPHAEAASGARAATSTRGRLAFAGIAALVIIGVAVLGWRGDLARWFGGETRRTSTADIPNFEDMTIERVSGLGQVGGPVISPDGKLLAYVRTEGAENAIWLRQMATGSVVKVVGPTLNSIYNVQFTPDNNFLYYSDNTTTRPIRYALNAVPAFGGPAREIAEGRFLRVSFSPDGKRFVVRRGLPVGWELVVMTTDGSAPASVIATSPTASQAFVSPSWSPSGDELAWINIETDPRIQMTLQFMKPDGTGARTLTPSGNPRPFLDQIAWTASDEALLATGGGSSRQILLIRTSDGHVERVTNDVHDYSALSFSPESGAIATVQTTQLGSIWIGPAHRPEEAREVPSRLGELDGAEGLSWLNDRELVFNRTVSNLSTLWTMQAEGGGARQLAQGPLAIATNPRADRGGRTVIFNGIREPGALPEVYRLTLPDGRVTQVTRENGAMAGSSSDGSTVYFQRFGIKTPQGEILRMAADGTPATRVFEAPMILDYSLSPDGTQIAVIANAGVGAPRTISLVPAEGGAARSIFTSTAALWQVRWYPAGDALLLTINENRQNNFFRLELTGGPPRQLTHFTRGTVLNAEISPDGRRIAYHRGTAEPDLVLLKPQKD